MEYGFVYLWRDKKYNKYYVGSHWGPIDDRYICSSDNMYQNRKNRPQDFKRRVLKKIYTNRKDLLTEEQRWLDMIDHEDYGQKYYNISSKVTYGSWWMNEETKKQIIEKISIKTKLKMADPVIKEKMSLARLGKTYEEIYGEEQAQIIKQNNSIKNKDKIISKKQKQIISEYMTNHNPMKGRTGLNHPRYGKSHIAWNKGISCLEETKKKISISRIGKGIGNKNGFQKGQVPWNKGINKT